MNIENKQVIFVSMDALIESQTISSISLNEDVLESIKQMFFKHQDLFYVFVISYEPVSSGSDCAKRINTRLAFINHCIRDYMQYMDVTGNLFVESQYHMGNRTISAVTSSTLFRGCKMLYLPEEFQKAEDKMLMIGDNEFDVMFAKNSGIDYIDRMDLGLHFSFT